jgi:hypothetical protein
MSTYKADDCTEKAARFIVSCKANPATKVKVTEAMRVRGYSDHESTDLTLQMQVLCAIQKIKGKVTLHSEAMVAHSLLAIDGPGEHPRPTPVARCPVWGHQPDAGDQEAP